MRRIFELQKENVLADRENCIITSFIICIFTKYFKANEMGRHVESTHTGPVTSWFLTSSDHNCLTGNYAPFVEHQSNCFNGGIISFLMAHVAVTATAVWRLRWTPVPVSCVQQGRSAPECPVSLLITPLQLVPEKRLATYDCRMTSCSSKMLSIYLFSKCLYLNGLVGNHLLLRDDGSFGTIFKAIL